MLRQLRGRSTLVRQRLSLSRSRIGLKQRNLENLSKHVEDVSDPDSPNFGRHWSAEKIANTFAPLKETSEQTVQWLINSGVEASRIKHSTGRNWIEFESTVEEAERLLNTQYHVYKHNDSEGLRVACDEYSLPHTVREHIDFIMPTIQLDGLNPVARKLVKFEASPDITGLTGTENCDKAITIDCLRARYNIPISNSHVANNKLGIVEWADYLYLPDLKTFFQNYTDPKIPDDTTPEFISIDGGKKGTYDRVKAGTAGESALDFPARVPDCVPTGNSVVPGLGRCECRFCPAHSSESFFFHLSSEVYIAWLSTCRLRNRRFSTLSNTANYAFKCGRPSRTLRDSPYNKHSLAMSRPSHAL